MDSTWFLIIALIAFTFMSAYCSGSEIALFSISSLKIKTYEKASDPRKQLIAQLLKHPRDLLVTIYMMNTLVNILLQNVASNIFGEQAGWDLKVGVPLLLTLFLGEIIPKNFCMDHNTKVAHAVVPSINFFHRLLKSVRKLTITITIPISRVMFFFLKREESISRNELEHVLKTSEEHGVLHPDEATLVWGYLKFQNTSIKEIMVPKEDVLFFDINEPFTKLIHLFVDEECSRIPICNGDLDKIIGVMHSKQFFIYHDQLKESSDIAPYLSKPFYVPETTLAKSLLKQFDEANQVLALVVDEYGSIAGLVSREDIAELIVGEITDRRDQNPLYTIAGKNEIIASGKLELTEFNRLFNTNLESESNMVTIGGWLIEEMGEIPKSGTQYKTDNFLFQVLSAHPNRIRRLYIRQTDSKRGLL
jgi:putative hemolysin